MQKLSEKKMDLSDDGSEVESLMETFITTKETKKQENEEIISDIKDQSKHQEALAEPTERKHRVRKNVKNRRKSNSFKTCILPHFRRLITKRIKFKLSLQKTNSCRTKTTGTFDRSLMTFSKK